MTTPPSFSRSNRSPPPPGQLPGLKGETTDAFLAEIKAILANPDASLTAPLGALLADVDHHQLNQALNTVVGEPTPYAEYLAQQIPNLGSPSIFINQFLHNFKTFKRNAKVKAFNKANPLATIARAAVALRERDRAILLAAAHAYTLDTSKMDEWRKFYANFIWHDGQCDLTFPPPFDTHKHILTVKESIQKIVQSTQPTYKLLLEQTVKRVSEINHPDITNILQQGSRWRTTKDIGPSFSLSHTRQPSSLLLGQDELGKDVYFSGPQSLFTLAPPNSGKSQAHVITNLLTFPGSAFVLDVKGELWDETAGYRQKHFGPVFRFAPTDKSGRFHCYNPFDFVSTDPDDAALDCQLLAQQLIPANPDLKDPFWENRARDFVWAFAMIVALKGKGPSRSLVNLTKLFSISMALPDDDDPSTDLTRLLKTLRTLYDKTQIPDLETAANTIDAGMKQESERLESVFDQARRHTSTFARSSYIRYALSRSDWQPLDLRNKPGMTVYFCLKPGELQAFAPLVRLIFQQHAHILTRDFTFNPKRDLPITFFLDEMPQLGNMPALSDLIDLGRGAGLRLWLLAQNIAQIRKHYGRLSDSLINNCAVRCFMNLDPEAAKFVAPNLGTTRHLFSGEKRPLAEPHDLLGPAYADKIVTLVQGELPAAFGKVFAFARYPKAKRPPPPILRSRLPRKPLPPRAFHTP